MWIKLRMERGALSGDLYFCRLRSRDRDEVIDYEWIAERPTVTRLRLLPRSTSGVIRVARAEAVWVLKLIAGREQDLTDLFAMRSQSIDLEEVRSKLVQVVGGRTRQVAVRLENRLNDPKLFDDALTRRELGSPRAGRNIAAWAAFRKTVPSVVELR